MDMSYLIISLFGILGINSFMHVAALLRINKLEGKVGQFIDGCDPRMKDHSRRIGRLEEHQMGKQ